MDTPTNQTDTHKPRTEAIDIVLDCWTDTEISDSEPDNNNHFCITTRTIVKDALRIVTAHTNTTGNSFISTQHTLANFALPPPTI